MSTSAMTERGIDTSMKVNGQRLWDSLMTMAKIGATAKGGVCRLALT
ncbi:MAG TPA: Zn-dependent hydrolase, partial [Trinickia sp.]